MKIISAITIWLIFLLFELLKIKWMTDFGYYFLFWVEEMWWADFSWITKLINAFLIIPEVIFLNNSDFLINLSTKIYNWFTANHILYLIIFIYYYLFSYISSLCLKFIRLDRDKKFCIFLIISIYLILIRFLV